MADAVAMILRCYEHQNPESFGRPGIEAVTGWDLYGVNRPRDQVADAGPNLPPADPGYPEFQALA